MSSETCEHMTFYTREHVLATRASTCFPHVRARAFYTCEHVTCSYVLDYYLKMCLLDHHLGVLDGDVLHLVDQLDPNPTKPIRRLDNQGLGSRRLHHLLQLLLVLRHDVGAGHEVEDALAMLELHPLVVHGQAVLPAHGEEAGELVDLYLEGEAKKQCRTVDIKLQVGIL